MKKLLITMTFFGIITAAFVYFYPGVIYSYQEIKKPELPLAPEANLEVPFYPQAPDGNWDMPWQEACEEASVTLSYYYATKQDITKDKFKEEILKMVDWEMETYGYFEHTNIDETLEMLVSNFQIPNPKSQINSKIKARILEDVTAKDLKQELSQGNVIVAPFAGRMLNNPFYSGEGPYYHMMVIKGYGDGKFITHDVGTKRGEDYAYTEEVLMNALHDWHDEDIELGAKRVITISP